MFIIITFNQAITLKNGRLAQAVAVEFEDIHTHPEGATDPKDIILQWTAGGYWLFPYNYASVLWVNELPVNIPVID